MREKSIHETLSIGEKGTQPRRRAFRSIVACPAREQLAWGGRTEIGDGRMPSLAALGMTTLDDSRRNR